MINLILALVAVGVLLWLLDTHVPMDATIKKMIHLVVIVCVVLYLFKVFGIYDVPVPRLR